MRTHLLALSNYLKSLLCPPTHITLHVPAQAGIRWSFYTTITCEDHREILGLVHLMTTCVYTNGEKCLIGILK